MLLPDTSGDDTLGTVVVEAAFIYGSVKMLLDDDDAVVVDDVVDGDVMLLDVPIIAAAVDALVELVPLGIKAVGDVNVANAAPAVVAPAAIYATAGPDNDTLRLYVLG